MNPLLQQDHLFGPLFSDAGIEALWSSARFLDAFLTYEVALAEALAEAGVVAPEAAHVAVEAMSGFHTDALAVRAAVSTDGVPTPEFIRQIKAHVPEAGRAAVHQGATSQDLIDTAIMQILRDANRILDERLAALSDGLAELEATWGTAPMMGRTRMQAAMPIRVRDRVETWRAPLQAHRAGLAALRPRLEVLQFGGAVGDRAGLGGRGDAVAEGLARRLSLGNPPRAWHAMRGVLADYAGWLSTVTGTLGKVGQDICLMAQQGIDEAALSGGGTSSAMPHKQNPVRAELLVTLARYNAGQLATMHHAMLHEQERSGAAWTLEWMTLPGMVTATGRALLHANALQAQITRLGAQV